jgi:hypothetical protein
MSDDLYLDGDPDTESTRRHMERVLKGEQRRRWTWLLGALAGGTAIAFWRLRRASKADASAPPRAGRQQAR